MAVPFMVGDSYKGRRIVGTSPLMFSYDDDGQIRMIVWIESTEGVANAEAICRASPRLIGASSE